MRFEFDNVYLDTPLQNKWDVFLRIVGDFHIVVNGRIVYSEAEFCVVEFAISLGNWLLSAGSDEPDFVYTSLESETEGLVRFTRCGDGEWLISAALESPTKDARAGLRDIQLAARTYIQHLRNRLLPRVDIFDYGDAKFRSEL